MSRGSRICATGLQAGMTTSAADSLRTLPAMKPQMTHDQRIRREPGSLLKASGGTKCVVIACTADCGRTGAHIAAELGEQLRVSIADDGLGTDPVPAFLTAARPRP